MWQKFHEALRTLTLGIVLSVRGSLPQFLNLSLDTDQRNSAICQAPGTILVHPTSSQDVPCSYPSSVSQLPSELIIQPDTSNHSRMELPFLKLPQSQEEWASADEDLSVQVVPEALAFPTVEREYEILSMGVYNYFSQHFGTRKLHKQSSRRRKHKKKLKEIAAQKNEAKRKMRSQEGWFR